MGVSGQNSSERSKRQRKKKWSERTVSHVRHRCSIPLGNVRVECAHVVKDCIQIGHTCNIPIFNRTVRRQDRIFGGTTTDPIRDDFPQTSIGITRRSVPVRQRSRPKRTGGAIIQFAKEPRGCSTITRTTSTGISIVHRSITDSTRGHFRTSVTGRQTIPTTRRSAIVCSTHAIIVIYSTSISHSARRDTS